jgi:hypothetical protein
MENFNLLTHALMIGTANTAKLSTAIISDFEKLGLDIQKQIEKEETAKQLLWAAAIYAPLLRKKCNLRILRSC